MIDISLGGLIGAIAGIVVSAIVYGVVESFLERLYRRWRIPAEQDRATLQQELALLRRAVLTVDLLLFCGLGYWIGEKIGG